MSIQSQYKTIQDAKKAGWFSRRHQTNKEHLANRERLIAKGKKIKNK